MKNDTLLNFLIEIAPETSDEALDMICQRGLSELPVKWNGRLRKSLGRCRFRGGDLAPIEIDLNPSKLMIERRTGDPDIVRKVFLHELAHAIAGHAAGHGPTFKRVCRILGTSADNRKVVTSEATRAAGATPLKIVATCQKCGKDFRRKRRLARNKSWSHPGCGGELRLY